MRTISVFKVALLPCMCYDGFMSKNILEIKVSSTDYSVLDTTMRDFCKALKPLEGATDGFDALTVKVNPAVDSADAERVYNRSIFVTNPLRKALALMSKFDIPHKVNVRIVTVD